MYVAETRDSGQGTFHEDNKTTCYADLLSTAIVWQRPDRYANYDGFNFHNFHKNLNYTCMVIGNVPGHVS